MRETTMYCGVQINVLLLVFYCFVFFISSLPCNGSAKSNNEETNKNTSSSPANFSLIPEVRSKSNVSTKIEAPVFLEGGSTVVVNPQKTTVKTSAEEQSLSLSDENRHNLLASDLESLATGTSSNHNHVSKARKGVNANDSETSTTEHSISEQTSSSPTVSTVKMEQTSLKDLNNDTNDSSKQTSPAILNKISSNESHSSTKAPLQMTSKLELQNKTGSIDIKGNENMDTAQNSTLISTTMLSTPKLKPEFTRVDSTADDQSSFAFSSENDYVIPVVAIIFAAPLFAILGMVLYKRSKEFWERRHYRRMDFLIDGMYND